MLNNTFTWNGHSSDEYGIFIERKPNLDRSARKFQTASVPGRNGNIYQLQDAWEEVIVSYEIFAGGPQEGDAVGAFTNVMEWLNSANGYAKLSDTYDSTHYRLGVFVDLTTITSKWHAHGRAIVSFRCRPERFIVTSALTPTSGSTIANSTKHTAEPIITLTGGGGRSLLKLEGRTKVEPPISDNINYYDSIAEFISTMGSKYFLGQGGSGNYVGLYGSSLGSASSLVDSTGVIQITGGTLLNSLGIGFILEAVPDSDYSISFESDNYALCTVKFATQGGNSIIGSAWKEDNNSTGTWKAFSWTFHTPSECAYMFINFGKCSGRSAVPKFRKVMVNNGSTALPFVGYSNFAVDSSLTLNDTTISFSTADGFATAVIDCEHENFDMDGVNSNNVSSIIDQYGNLAVEYLNLQKGNNTISFDGEITAVSIDPRFWEL